MGLISKVVDIAFGGERNVVRDTVEVFRENAEAGARAAQLSKAKRWINTGRSLSHLPRAGLTGLWTG